MGKKSLKRSVLEKTYSDGKKIKQRFTGPNPEWNPGSCSYGAKVLPTKPPNSNGSCNTVGGATEAKLVKMEFVMCGVVNILVWSLVSPSLPLGVELVFHYVATNERVVSLVPGLSISAILTLTFPDCLQLMHLALQHSLSFKGIVRDF